MGRKQVKARIGLATILIGALICASIVIGVTTKVQTDTNANCPKLHVLAFCSKFCPPCRAAQPALATLAKSFDVIHYSAESQKDQPVFQQFHVDRWPTFIAIDDGNPNHSLFQTHSIDEMTKWLHDNAD